MTRFIEIAPGVSIVATEKQESAIEKALADKAAADKEMREVTWPACVERARTEFRGCFEDSGYRLIRLDEIPNEYCPKPYCCPPWFNVETTIGRIKIGQCKRVINIDWTGIPVDGLALFGGEQVTYGSNHIHAWNGADCRRYLRGILAHFEAMGMPPVDRGTRRLSLSRASRVTCLTFGGQQVWTTAEGEVFLFHRIVEDNASYVIVASGLNHYVFEKTAIAAISLPSSEP